MVTSLISENKVGDCGNYLSDKEKAALGGNS
jgi:hypothetical protein